MQYIRCITGNRGGDEGDGRLPNTIENEREAYSNLSFFSKRSNPIDWIHPCSHCQLQTWRVARVEKKIVYLCKTCLTLLLTN